MPSAQLHACYALALLLASCAGAPPPTPTAPLELQIRTLARSAPELPGHTLNLDPPLLSPPYSLEHVISTFGDCRSGGRQHRGLDLAGVGPDAGLGTPIFAAARSKITLIGTPDIDPKQFGTWDKRSGATTRRGKTLPRSADIDGYGEVFFFSRKIGSWRSGVVIVTEILDGPLQGHQLRYMHMATVHPNLQVGQVVEAGQEIGLMGGTAIQKSTPHVHLDLETPEGTRLDLAPYLGLPPDNTTCAEKRR